ncbi:MAG: hypothetical protein IID46_15675 [Planctomycetes bacterium]|nr:hypothetical protein [Planctomycetota bacterium]
MGFWDSVKEMFAGVQAKVSGGKVVTCPHCGTQNTANGYGSSPIPGVTVTEALEVDCRSCGKMFIVMQNIT